MKAGHLLFSCQLPDPLCKVGSWVVGLEWEDTYFLTLVQPAKKA